MTSPEDLAISSESTNEGDQSGAFYRSLQSEAVPQPQPQAEQPLPRGDHQLPDEPNRGFEITRLDREPLAQPVPAEVALPFSYRGTRLNGTEATKLMTDDLARRIAGGINPLKPVESAAREMGIYVDFSIPASSYETAVSTGQVEDGLFNESNKLNGLDPRSPKLDNLISPEQKLATLEAATAASARKMSSIYRDDLAALKPEERDELAGVIEAFELSDGNGDRTIRLLNFSKTHLSDERLRQATNVVRSFSDKTGGAIFDTLHTIAILPEEHSRMRTKIEREDGQVGEVLRGGLSWQDMVMISDRLIKAPEDRLPKPKLGREKTPFELYGLPGEPEEGPGSPPQAVGADDFETTLAHELGHNALPAMDRGNLPRPAPTLYGRSHPGEHIAELSAAEYTGGEHAQAVPADQQAALGEMYQRYRGSEDSIKYKQPLGPRYVVCRELDLTQGPLPPRMINPSKSMAAEITYHLVSDKAA
jgi:hypothetical protein